ncbi:tigger transposable element-derived protein 6-like [Lucilia sericata]|uniref:tigger transposable element-derived protein 6-like n=1 Tax=Lucilia sericata TaxID=13632 RepID=UPI0018A85315|nr:tigger transposable element-derived protein 6-like [Lucilia sericata]
MKKIYIRNLALSSNWKSKRQRKGEHPNVEKALAVWFDEMRGQNAIVTSSMLVNKAKELGIQMNEEFEPDYSWLFRWRRRFNINFNLVQRETSKNDNLEVDDFSSMVLPNLLNEYSPDCVFNAKESGLYYKALPNTRYFKKGDQPNACKSQKSRLTLLFVCNSTGSYKQVFCIGKPKKSISFKYKNLPITYYSNKYAWMTNVIWNEILSIIDKEMQENNMKILLFIDNAACHKVTIPLENIKIHFLPRNNTALKQPLDQGIIHCFKYQYRKIIVTKQLCALKKGLTTNLYI